MFRPESMTVGQKIGVHVSDWVAAVVACLTAAVFVAAAVDVAAVVVVVVSVDVIT